MTDIKRYESVTPDGLHEFVCKTCGFKGRSSSARLVYCSERCSDIAYSRRHYRRNRDKVFKANLARYHTKKGGKTKKS
jgi:hypothetical protein